MPAWWRVREIRRDVLWIVPLALLVQAFWAARLQHPSYFDAYYYTTNAERLAAGHGFTEEIIWQYLDDPPGLPAPSFTYWMPLPAIIGAVGYRLIGTFRGAQLPFWLMAALLPWLAYLISWRLTRQRWQARTAALFTLSGGYYAAYWSQPTTFTLFGLVGAGCLLALADAQDQAPGGRQLAGWLLGGMLAGLGHLTRADGLLLLGTGGIVWLWTVWDWRRGRITTGLRPLLGSLGALGAGYLLIMGGWFWHTYQVTGRPMSVAGAQTMFLTNYNDVFAYGRSFDWSSYLAWGWGNILRSKAEAVWLGAQTFIAVTGLTVFTLFFVWAWIRLGRRPDSGRFLRPFTWYTISLYAVMSLVFTFPGQRGSLLHSSTALWPWSMALAVAGVDVAVEWMAARRRHWRPAQAKRLFAAVFVLMVFVVSLVVSSNHPLNREEAAVYRDIAAALPADAVVMTGSPPDFYYHTGLRAVVVPNEPPAVLLQVARRYGVDYLVLNQDRPPVLAPLYEGQVQLPEITPVRIYAEDTVLYRFELP